ncbi:MAG: hypothetical protein EBZ77_07310 [Chitinophagia bacterium]|nr:hypothetical protein [Chitinophagia bacterium]
MKSKLLVLIPAAVALVGAIAAGCHKKDTALPHQSFKTDIVPILRANCATGSNCHSGATNKGDNMNFDSSAAYNTIVAQKLVNTSEPLHSLLYVEVYTGNMPKAPYTKLTDADLNKILSWIIQGAQNN